ncbi:MAG: TIGR00730 family Rossman fold protein [Armatimonas sp.]
MKAICVYCGSSFGKSAVYGDAARALGTILAEREISLIYGGASSGLMGIVADAVLDAGGKAIGVLPDFMKDKEIAHTRLSQLYVVDSMHERKAKMASLADGFIALPGGFGTLEEIFEALTWAQVDIHNKPCAFLNINGYFDMLFTFMDHMASEGLLRPRHRALPLLGSEPHALLDTMAAYKATPAARWDKT